MHRVCIEYSPTPGGNDKAQNKNENEEEDEEGKGEEEGGRMCHCDRDNDTMYQKRGTNRLTSPRSFMYLATFSPI